MHSVSKKEFDRHRIIRSPTLLQQMGYPRATRDRFCEECFWYEHDDLLGIVLFDKIDRDWSFVALREYNDGFRCFDVGVSLESAEAAELALRKVLELGERSIDDSC